MLKLTWTTKGSQLDGGKARAIRGTCNSINAPQKNVHVLLTVGLVSVKVSSGHWSMLLLWLSHFTIFLVPFTLK